MRKELKELIKSDFIRYYGNNKKPILWKIKDHTLFLTTIYRKAHFYHLKKCPIRSIFYRYKLAKLSYKFGFNISYKTSIGYGLALTHNGTFNINASAILGNNCNIGVNVLIGQENRGKRKGTPIIGDRVWIGANAVIVGKINIGNNVLIAPNSFVNFDVPDDSIVIGNPAKIIHSDRATEKYLTNLIKI